jgi:single-stranded DNA-binding protein
MHSFTLTAVGNLARNPELIVKNETIYARFCLLGSDYGGRDEGGGIRDLTTSVWFVAFGTLGEVIARTARKGDQLFVQARVRSGNCTDQNAARQYEHSFIVNGFRFGAQSKAREEVQRLAPSAVNAQAVGERS